MLLIVRVVWLIRHVWHNFGIQGIELLIKIMIMEILSFVFLCAVGVLMYWFFFKCIDWFEKI